MRRAEGPLRDEAGRRVQHAGHGVNLGRLQRLLESERRQDRRQPFGQHRLARSGRADHEDVMAARRGDLESALGRLLPAHVFEIYGKVLQLAQQSLSRNAIRLALNHAHDRLC